MCRLLDFKSKRVGGDSLLANCSAFFLLFFLKYEATLDLNHFHIKCLVSGDFQKIQGRS